MRKLLLEKCSLAGPDIIIVLRVMGVSLPVMLSFHSLGTASFRLASLAAFVFQSTSSQR